MTEAEMAGCHHRLYGREFESIPGWGRGPAGSAVLFGAHTPGRLPGELGQPSPACLRKGQGASPLDATSQCPSTERLRPVTTYWYPTHSLQEADRRRRPL